MSGFLDWGSPEYQQSPPARCGQLMPITSAPYSTRCHALMELDTDYGLVRECCTAGHTHHSQRCDAIEQEAL